jgi:hypothetical protein
MLNCVVGLVLVLGFLVVCSHSWWDWLGVFEILIIIWIFMLMNSFWMQYKGRFYG